MSFMGGLVQVLQTCVCWDGSQKLQGIGVLGEFDSWLLVWKAMNSIFYRGCNDLKGGGTVIKLFCGYILACS